MKRLMASLTFLFLMIAVSGSYTIPQNFADDNECEQIVIYEPICVLPTPPVAPPPPISPIIRPPIVRPPVIVPHPKPMSLISLRILVIQETSLEIHYVVMVKEEIQKEILKEENK